MKKGIGVLVLLVILMCSAAAFSLSLTARDTLPTAVEAAPALMREYRRTDTLDELQEFYELENPPRPIWAWILVAVVAVVAMLLIGGTPFLKQFNSSLRLFKRRGSGSSAGGRPSATPTIVLPPDFGRPALPPPQEEEQW